MNRNRNNIATIRTVLTDPLKNWPPRLCRVSNGRSRTWGNGRAGKQYPNIKKKRTLGRAAVTVSLILWPVRRKIQLLQLPHLGPPTPTTTTRPPREVNPPTKGTSIHASTVRRKHVAKVADREVRLTHPPCDVRLPSRQPIKRQQEPGNVRLLPPRDDRRRWLHRRKVQ